jgi:hypothetical protein
VAGTQSKNTTITTTLDARLAVKSQRKTESREQATNLLSPA